ncbi:MAG TPA: DUF6427 family protein [Chryseosolibacter sp.]
MIRYFRINDPYRLAGLFALLVIMYLPLFIYNSQLTIPELKDLLVGEKQNEGYRMYSGLIDNTGPLAAWSDEILDTLFGRSLLARHLLAFAVIFLQSAYIGIVFISKKVFSENTYIPSFLFSLLFFFSYDTLSLSNELLGSGFLLLALNYLFQEVEFRNERDESIFNLGLCISLASLFIFSFSIYLVGAIVILVLFTRSTLRKFMLLIFGYLLPHLLVISLSYLNDATGEVWRYFYVASFSLDHTQFMTTRALLTLGAIPLFYFAVSMVMLNREARFSKYQSQILQTVLLWLVFSLLFVFLSDGLRPQSLIVFIPGLSFLFTHFFLLIRRKKFVALNSWILFVGIVGMAYLAKFGRIGAVSYSQLLVNNAVTDIKGKRILVLEDNLDIYSQNSLATPYLNWDLSQDVLRHPEYYENVTHVFHSFKNDPPEIVFDKENLLEGFFNRMPGIGAQYVRQGDRYVRKVSN